MRSKKRIPLGRRVSQWWRSFARAMRISLFVALLISVTLWADLFTSAQARATNYLYRAEGDPGDEIVIVAIDERSQQELGDWPWPLEPYARMFQEIEGAKVIGFDVLLPDAGPQGEENENVMNLLEAVDHTGDVVMPLATLKLSRPASPGQLYAATWPIRPFPALLDAAVSAGSVEAAPDADGILRRAPLLVDTGEDSWEAFSLQILRLYLDLGQTPASLVSSPPSYLGRFDPRLRDWLESLEAISLSRYRVVIGDQSEVKYETRTDAHGAVLVNYVGAPNTFPTYSFVDVMEGDVPAGAFEGKIVLVGMMNALNEMDLHRTPVSTGRMAGVEFQANAIHTLLHHQALAPQSKVDTTLTIAALALLSAITLSQLGALSGVLFTLLLAVGYFFFTGFQFDSGHLPNVLFPYATIFINYAAVTAARFAGERSERYQVTEVFGRFVSTEVRDRIVNMALRDPDLIQPGGRQMEISVLFADIRGFTTISENLPPSEVVEILNCYLDSMEREVFEQEGTLDKYTGDGMMVLFGAPLEHPDHAAHAVRAALGMQRAAAEVSSQRGDLQCKLAYGIGIATGPAVVGHIGSPRRLDYTAIGDTVNLAARLEGQAPPGAVLISQATYEAVKEIAVVEPLEPMKLKGKAKPVIVYRVLGLR